MTPVEQSTVSQYLHTQLPTQGDLTFSAFKGGASNLTYAVKDEQQEWIMRTSPPGTKAKGAHDMNREYKLLQKLHPHFNLCPEVVLFCDDEAVFPREFYLMKPINGIIIRQQLPDIYNGTDLSQLCKQLMAVHVKLHQVPTHNLQNFNKGPGYIERQITGWVHRYNRVTPENDVAQPVIQWLSKNMPNDNREYTLIHNDYKFDNVVFDPNNTNKIIGVLDWEMTTIGDPLMDLGCSLAYWFEANDHKAMQKISMMPTYLDGMLSRDELVHQYSLSSGLVIDDYHFYYIYGLFRLAVIVQQIFYRYQKGQTDNPAFKPMGMIRDLILKQALTHLK